ncbi:PEP-CTERM sorting domain-containing protein [Magnetospira sp. QH-2]|uniref:PEP-CTERM sorting domain-containing protein n=1 Tax=Magnetospira sp. (strain QH-2) TaxID=1288970 RepID=UPI0003E80E7E|nr:PEP-CTERM sorting domain-containing protein [Magnetospira sp. QH-2]CCQ75575.1 exported protein of unknown function[Include PEP-CTERM motif] [Magnetospira sp. QH-2]
MKKSLIVSAIAAAFFAFSPVQAAPIDFSDNDWFTTDNVSGLDWLDLTETQGWSLNQVNASATTIGGHSLDGWQVATVDQVMDMAANFTGMAINPNPAAWNLSPLSSNLLDLVGRTLSYESWFWTADLFQGVINNVAIVPRYSGAASGPDASWNVAGFMMVRDSGADQVPEPATLALFGMGLAGLGIARRRSRKAA